MPNRAINKQEMKFYHAIKDSISEEILDIGLSLADIDALECIYDSLERNIQDGESMMYLELMSSDIREINNAIKK